MEFLKWISSLLIFFKWFFFLLRRALIPIPIFWILLAESLYPKIWMVKDWILIVDPHLTLITEPMQDRSAFPKAYNTINHSFLAGAKDSHDDSRTGGNRDCGYRRSLIHNIYGRETLNQDTKTKTSSFSS